MDNISITEKIINWYKINGRDLPWRKTTDPYKIWLSEIILQQTRVKQGTPYYHKFVDKYPTIEALATASEQEVLRLWQGLGYYSRARNLHACAKILMDKYNGIFPKTYAEIIKLPGIGKYTAAAIASFAFKEVVPVIDGNVFRVLSRLYGIEEDILANKSRQSFERVADDLISKQEPDIFNQAIMEFGSAQCKPQNPDCASCPLNLECFARSCNRQHDFPVKIKKVKVRKRHITYIVFKQDNLIWLKKRPKGDIWRGLYDFYLVEEAKQHKEIEEVLNTAGVRNGACVDISPDYKHILTHQLIYARFVLVDTQTNNSPKSMLVDGNFYSTEEIKNLPKPVLVSRYLNEVIF